MLAGIVVALLLAGGAATVYVLAFHQPTVPHASPLPSRAVSVESVGLVVSSGAAGTGGGKPLQLISRRALAPQFSPLGAAQLAAGSPQWTADLMGNSTYIFIFLASDTCLTSTGTATNPALALQHCNLSAQQRWRRLSPAVIVGGHDYYQYASSSDGKCLTMTARLADGDYGTGLAACGASQPASQLISFWWSSV